MRTLRMTDFNKLVSFVNEFTEGQFKFGYTGGDLGYGSRYIDGIRQLVWLGSQGGRWCAASYYTAALLKWARLDDRMIPDDISELIREIRAAVPHRWAKRATEAWDQGASDAEYRWESLNTLVVRNDEGLRFHVVYRPGGVIEFYDVRYGRAEGFTNFGQFTGARYDVRIFLARPEDCGLHLHGGVEAWRISADNVREVQAWLTNRLLDR